MSAVVIRAALPADAAPGQATLTWTPVEPAGTSVTATVTNGTVNYNGSIVGTEIIGSINGNAKTTTGSGTYSGNFNAQSTRTSTPSLFGFQDTGRTLGRGPHLPGTPGAAQPARWLALAALSIRHEKTAHQSGFFMGAEVRQTLNRKFITSPSLTTYSLPSARILPASLAPCSPL